jgi:hypothetical protein
LPAPGNLTITQITGTTAHVNWDVVYTANYYKLVLTNLYTNNVEQQYVLTVSSKNLSGLLPNTKYRVDVAASACDNHFPGPYASKIFTTGIIVTDDIVFFDPNAAPNQYSQSSHLSQVNSMYDGTEAYICLRKDGVGQGVKAFHGIISSCNVNLPSFENCSRYLEFSMIADQDNYVHFPSSWAAPSTGFYLSGTLLNNGGSINMQNQNSTSYTDLGIISVNGPAGNTIAQISVMYPPSSEIVTIKITLTSGFKLYYSPDYVPQSTGCANAKRVAQDGNAVIDPLQSDLTNISSLRTELMEYSNSWVATPNPFTDAFHLQFDLETSSECHAAIYDAYGRLIGEVIQHDNLPAGQYEYRVETARWTPGLYFLRFQNGAESKVIKLMKE